MNADSELRSPDRLAEAFAARWAELAAGWTERPGTVLATLGPAGTSSHLAAESLAGPYGLRVVLCPSFDQVLERVLAHEAEFALVPSAYQGLTRFHWHRDLRLRAFFPMATPEYGIAAPRDGGIPEGSGPVTVAAMWEVRWIYPEVLPPGLHGRAVTWVDAASTQHAARLLSLGRAQLALTNAPGVRRHGLRWLGTRPGAEIIWTLFGRGDL